jgi:hypothetical protein
MNGVRPCIVVSYTQLTKKVNTFEMKTWCEQSTTIGVTKVAMKQVPGNWKVGQGAPHMAVVNTA